MAEKGKFPSDEQDQFMLRMPDGLRDRIKDKSAKNNRSMNAEIIATLLAAYPPIIINVTALGALLNGMSDTEDEDHAEYVEQVNDALQKTKQPYVARVSRDGVVAFYPTETEDD